MNLYAVVSVVIFASAGSLLYMHQTGSIAELNEKTGIQAQAIADKNRTIEQGRMRELEAAVEVTVMQERHQQEIAVLVEQRDANEQAVREANQLLADFRAMRGTDADLDEWANRIHPDAVARLLNAAAANTAGTHSGNAENLRLSTERPD